jgi:hypothetical protein
MQPVFSLRLRYQHIPVLLRWMFDVKQIWLFLPDGEFSLRDALNPIKKSDRLNMDHEGDEACRIQFLNWKQIQTVM